ncbi:hypothetical protein CWI38_0558p0040 [Hamiltosporidium tvaerminnensis]|uniref:Uncharacterized protein n=1 Tax=Hamiltosporidium tvaerminnensis TaxID=1176355 RepID=A0A4Q9LYL3_9MICR|nr:hypothetical protein CWI38_0558p0040 [Hamiltosporidium tvaerminnensis]
MAYLKKYKATIYQEIGVVRLEAADFFKIDSRMRARFYLPRTELVRGIESLELDTNKTFLALIKSFLKSVGHTQPAKLYNEIEKRKLHSKLYNPRKIAFMYTRIKTDDNIQNNRLDIYILDKRK